MRICLVSHGYPPLERTGVENYTEALARGLVRSGHEVEVFAPRRALDLPDLSVRRVEQDGYGLTWLSTNADPRDPAQALNPPGIAARFAAFLERERPHIVHFQHVIKLGIDLLSEARARGIPTVYTAHDYYPVCHRFTLMKPDLSRCTTPSEAPACARCDLALALLNRIPELGDYHMGALPEQLEPAQREQLVLALDEREPEQSEARAERAAALELRARIDGERHAAFEQIDIVLAPTRFLARQLELGGLSPARIRHLPYGIETTALAGLPPVRAEGEARARKLRFGFIGGVSKHKGVHVLLEAYARLGSKAELAIWGSSSDRAYCDRMQARALELGASWNGPFEHAQLADCLAAIDVLVVPSIWYENYPIAIREAFAALRPVIASRVGALPESVRDGIDGLLFEVGDARTLSHAMQRCIDQPELVPRLAAGIERVHDMRAQVAELEHIYAELLARGAHATEPRLPASAVAALERVTALQGLPTRDLFRQALTGLEQLRSALGVAQVPVHELLYGALHESSETAVAIRDGESERNWLRDLIAARDATERAYAEREAWHLSQIATDRSELEWRRADASGLQSQAEALRKECEWLRETVDNLETARASLERERDWHRETIDNERRTSEALRAERDWLRERAEAPSSAAAGNQVELEAEHAQRKQLEQRLQLLERELEWRRAEMRAAQQAVGGLLRGVVGRSRLGRRVSGWSTQAAGEATPPSEKAQP